MSLCSEAARPLVPGSTTPLPPLPLLLEAADADVVDIIEGDDDSSGAVVVRMEDSGGVDDVGGVSEGATEATAIGFDPVGGAAGGGCCCVEAVVDDDTVELIDNSSCKFFSYSVCLPCCISSFVKLAASSPKIF